MAEIDSSFSRKPLNFGKDAPRVAIALQATYQISEMLGVLLDKAENGACDVDGHLMMAMGLRMEQLNSIAMSAIDDETEDIESLRVRLFGRAAEVAHV